MFILLAMKDEKFQKKEFLVRAMIDKNLYESVEKAIKEAEKYGINISLRDVVLKGLKLKDEELAKTYISCLIDKGVYKKFSEVKKKIKHLRVEEVISAGMQKALNEYEKIIKTI